MNIQLPSVGPIVGYTDAQQSRIFLRGNASVEPNRSLAVIRYKAADTADWSAPLCKYLSTNFDMTAVLVLHSLQADTAYIYQAGWLSCDESPEQLLTSVEQLQWPSQEYAFHTGTDDPATARRYIVGSCRYLLRLFGANFFDDRGDKAFRSMLTRHANQRIDGVMMIGDQIYADDLNVLLPDHALDKFLLRYQDAFSQPHVQQLMAHVPTYMVLDDHEIEDNWPASGSAKDRVTLYPNAMHAYQIYQCSHSPIFSLNEHGQIEGSLAHYWYIFSDGCADWFVLDARTERKVDAQSRSMLSDHQMAALKDWLIDGSGKAKLIVSSVMFFPDLRDDAADTWKAFPEQRGEILEFIRLNAVKKVAFISGDVHCSLASRLTCDQDAQFGVVSIVSSPLFWPLPNTRADAFHLNQPLMKVAGTVYRSQQLSPVYAQDNFAELEVSPSAIAVQYFDRKGIAIGERMVIDW